LPGSGEYPLFYRTLGRFTGFFGRVSFAFSTTIPYHQVVFALLPEFFGLRCDPRNFPC
jgi:hypothetical protein